MIERLTFLSPSEEMWGAEQSLLAIAVAIKRVNPEIELRLLSASPEMVKTWNSSAGSATLLRVRGRNRWIRALSTTPVLCSLARNQVVVLWDIDLMIPAIICRAAYLLRNIQVVLDLHTVSSSPRGSRRLRWLTRWIDASIAVSRFAAQQVDVRTISRVVHRPVSLSDVATFAATDTPTVGIVGRICKQKQVLEALAFLSGVGSDLRVVIRGAPSGGLEGDEYFDAVMSEGFRLFGDRFQYEGRVNSKAALLGLDAIILFNDTEPSGRVVAEAQAHGVVPIVRSRGGAVEFVEDGETGCVLGEPVNDCDGRRVATLLSDASSLRILGRKAMLKARNDYDPETQARRYVEALAGARDRR